jgi:hypothetical protein
VKEKKSRANQPGFPVFGKKKSAGSRRDLEHYALIELAAEGGYAVKIPHAVREQRCLRLATVRAIGLRAKIV